MSSGAYQETYSVLQYGFANSQMSYSVFEETVELMEQKRLIFLLKQGAIFQFDSKVEEYFSRFRLFFQFKENFQIGFFPSESSISLRMEVF